MNRFLEIVVVAIVLLLIVSLSVMYGVWRMRLTWRMGMERMRRREERRNSRDRNPPM